MSIRSLFRFIADLAEWGVKLLVLLMGISGVYLGMEEGNDLYLYSGAIFLALLAVSYAIDWGSSSGKEEIQPSDAGLVYILTNPELSNVVKIGYTRRDAKTRAKELSGTGVPGEYRVAYQVKVSRPEELERKVHKRLSKYRSSSGEFFRVSAEVARREIDRVIRETQEA